MDYEKYKEALERASKLKADYQKELDKTDKNSQLAGLLRAGISTIDMAFPELAESEDERIRGVRDAIEGAIRVYGKTQGEWIGGYDMDTLVVHLREAFGALEKQKEQKPVEITPNQFDGITYGMKGYSSEKPVKWSEEDEKIRRNLMSLLANMRGDRITEETYQKYYPWLKDLRSRPKPSDNWKPSEEQMQYLLAVINDPNNAGAESCHLILESLYNDLKEL